MKPIAVGGHAVVLGASMAGLLTARVLTDAYDRVTVVERDILPPDPTHRRGVPQDRHVHALHARGRELLDELFSGFTEQVVQAGAVIGDSLGVFRWQLSGHQLRQVDIGLPALGASRPFLEGHLRQRVQALPAVRFVEGCDLVGLVTSRDQGRVTGVRVARRDEGATVQEVPADLVVDATGPGAGRIEHPGADEPTVQRFVTGTAAGDEPDLVRDRGVTPVNDLMLMVDEEFGVRRRHAAQRLGDDVGRVVDELLHAMSLTETVRPGS